MKVKAAKVRVKMPDLVRTFYEDTRLNFLRMIDSPRIMSEIGVKKMTTTIDKYQFLSD